MLSSAPSTPGYSASISFFPPLWAASTLFTFSMVSSSVILSHVPFKCHTMESKHDSRAVNTPKFSSVGKVTHLDQKNGLDSPTRYYCDAITCIPSPKGEYQYCQKLHVNTALLFQVQKAPLIVAITGVLLSSSQNLRENTHLYLIASYRLPVEQGILLILT